MNSTRRVTRDAPNSIYKNHKKPLSNQNKKMELRKSAEELSENRKFIKANDLYDLGDSFPSLYCQSI